MGWDKATMWRKPTEKTFPKAKKADEGKGSTRMIIFMYGLSSLL
tara:strand:+ start:3476 stop:3607 length:132 start_codon:yes stop_codon:yes gene_type:complete